MKKWIKRILAALLILVLVCVLAFCGLYLGRFKTLASIRKVSAYEDGYNLYRMDIKYDYSLDDIIASGITNDQSMVDAIVKEALPLLPVSIKAPSFGCTACHYCVSHCPKHLPIPDLLKLYNEAMVAGSGMFIAPMALSAIPAEHQPSACIACHSCEKVCPQQIHIPDALADFARRMGK